MKSCNAAVLVFFVWYFVVPPFTSVNGTKKPMPLAPISRWEVRANFDYLGDCQNFQAAALAHSTPGWNHLIYGQCVASDDPRLKGK